MRVGVGYCDSPDTAYAGRQAALDAVAMARRDDACDMVLLFSTAVHDAGVLRGAVASVVGPRACIVGGGAVGAITNDRFGYAGDQIGLACFWLDGARVNILAEGGLLDGEDETGFRLGRRLADIGTTRESPVMLFYDAIDRTGEGMRLLMATYLMAGIKRGLGFLPNLTGAGMQGDYACTPTKQWIGSEISQHHAIALSFSEDIRIDSVIMHGCHPATSYYTVTKADRQTILEIDETPAISFLNGLLGSMISPEEYPFFLILGINKGDKWGEFDENCYASRLCLGIDRERGGVVMFEPDMVAGTEFQIMYRSLDLQYMEPRIEALFAALRGRRPVFALYIDCAGRAAGYGGIDMEDAVMIQKIIGDRAPVLGIYSGVEIAPVGGIPLGLDWTGVLCLFSEPQ
jgi:small ligand-binding sensory domain FIST